MDLWYFTISLYIVAFICTYFIERAINKMIRRWKDGKNKRDN